MSGCAVLEPSISIQSWVGALAVSVTLCETCPLPAPRARDSVAVPSVCQLGEGHTLERDHSGCDGPWQGKGDRATLSPHRCPAAAPCQAPEGEVRVCGHPWVKITGHLAAQGPLCSPVAICVCRTGSSAGAMGWLGRWALALSSWPPGPAGC